MASVPETTRMFFMNGTGEVIKEGKTKSENAVVIKDQLRIIKRRSERLQVAYSKIVCVDDAAAWDVTIRSVFPDIRVMQDIKHLINRIVETVGTYKEGAAAFSMKLHEAFTTKNKVMVRSRNGAMRDNVPAPLDPPAEIIRRIDAVVANVKECFPALFAGNREFEKVLATQKENITKYVFDAFVDGKLYLI